MNECQAVVARGNQGQKICVDDRDRQRREYPGSRYPHYVGEIPSVWWVTVMGADRRKVCLVSLESECRLGGSLRRAAPHPLVKMALGALGLAQVHTSGDRFEGKTAQK